MMERLIDISKEFAKVIEWTPPWSTGAPCPQVFSNGQETYLSYYTDEAENNMVLVTFFRARSHRFGIVNDEAADGHPLYEKGLETYRAHIIENSTWIDEHKQIHKAHPRYSEEHWTDYKHFLLFFHDEIFEIIFSGEYKIEKFSMVELHGEKSNSWLKNGKVLKILDITSNEISLVSDRDGLNCGPKIVRHWFTNFPELRPPFTKFQPKLL